MMFLNVLDTHEVGEYDGRVIHQLDHHLLYNDDEFYVEVAAGFFTDYASVPRVPVVYWRWGDRAHRGAVIHDYGYRKGSRLWLKKEKAWVENPSRELVDYLFKRCNIASGYSWDVYWGMWAGVRLGGGSSYHRMGVNDCFPLKVKY